MKHCQFGNKFFVLCEKVLLGIISIDYNIIEETKIKYIF